LCSFRLNSITVLEKEEFGVIEVMLFVWVNDLLTILKQSFNKKTDSQNSYTILSVYL
jgi:hypothetical protein